MAGSALQVTSRLRDRSDEIPKTSPRFAPSGNSEKDQYAMSRATQSPRDFGPRAASQRLGYFTASAHSERLLSVIRGDVS